MTTRLMGNGVFRLYRHVQAQIQERICNLNQIRIWRCTTLAISTSTNSFLDALVLAIHFGDVCKIVHIVIGRSFLLSYSTCSPWNDGHSIIHLYVILPVHMRMFIWFYLTFSGIEKTRYPWKRLVLENMMQIIADIELSMSGINRTTEEQRKKDNRR